MSTWVKVITYNIRYLNPGDGIYAWSNRVARVTGLLKKYSPDIFCLQEAEKIQVTDVADRLPEYLWKGNGRDNGQEKGEFCPVFYRADRFENYAHGQFWLSETPDIPGLGWDAECNRICTWVKLSLKGTLNSIVVFNTHLDHKGISARLHSAVLLKEKISCITGQYNLPAILTGDFNDTPESGPIQSLKEQFCDSAEISETPAEGPAGTFNNFDRHSVPEKRIDYIFLSRGVRVKKYLVVTDQFENLLPSDHYPVCIHTDL